MAVRGLATAVRRPRRRAVAAGLLLAATVWLAATSVPAPGSAAGTTWNIVVSPTTIGSGAFTSMNVTFSNLGGPSGDDDLGCVTVAIPAAFTVLLPTVSHTPPDLRWSVRTTGQTTLVIQASGGGDRLPPDDPTATVTVTMTVTSLVAGQYQWTATAYRSQDCKESFNDVVALTVRVTGLLPLPTPKPTPVPTPVPTPGPTPVATVSPRPTVAPTQAPPATAIPTPPGATSEPTHSPTPSESTGPGATPSPPPAGSGAASGGGPTTPGPPIGAGLLMPGMGPGGETDGGAPVIDLNTGFATPFGEGFAWAVPGLVLSVPGLLLVFAVIGAQAVGAFAWLPVVRRRIGGFGIGRKPSG